MIKALHNRELNGNFTPTETKLIGGLIEDKFFTLKKCSYTSVKLHDIQTKSVFAVAFSHDGSLVASTHADHTIRVLFYEPFGLTHTLRGHVRSPISLQFHPQNRYILASGCLAGQVFLWNLHSMVGTKMNQLCPFLKQPTHEVMHSVVHLPIGSIAFHPKGTHLVASRCRQLTLWNIASPKPIHTVFTEHENERIRGVLFDPFGRYLITAIRRVIPSKEVPALTPEVKVETWSPQRPKSGRLSKASAVKNALNKLIFAGQKRSLSSVASSDSSTPGGSESEPGPSGMGGGSGSRPAAGSRPEAGVHTPQPRLDAEPVGLREEPGGFNIEREMNGSIEGFQNRSLCTNCQAGAFSKHMVQMWENVSEKLPNISDNTNNIITTSAIMVTNVNFQVSSDGSFICLVEKEECGERGAILFLTVYSLVSETFKQCLLRTCTRYIPMCISITPFNKYIVTFSRHTDGGGGDNHAGMILTYQIPRKKFSEKQRLTRSMTKPPTTTPKFNKISIHDAMPINIARFGHLPWQGTIIGTCTGKLYLMRIDPRQILECPEHHND